METAEVQGIPSTYFDVLKELGNIGAGNAMTALSEMLGSRVDMDVPQVQLLDFKDVGEFLGGEEVVFLAVYLGVCGDVSGSMMFLTKTCDAKKLVSKILPRDLASAGEEMNEMEASAMREIGNIITGAYLNALSEMTGLRILSSPPDLVVDLAGAILSVPAVESGVLGDQLLLIESRFQSELHLSGYYILVPDMDSYRRILSSLGITLSNK